MTDKEVLETSQDLQERREKYLVFQLNSEQYGISLASIREVIALTNVTKIPNVPSYFYGLMNLRGTIISVIDLRVKLNMQDVKFEPRKTSIIIVEIDGFVLGMIVDEILQVMNILSSQINREVNIESKVKRDYISGIAHSGDGEHLLILLNVDKILGIEELKLLKESSEGQE